MFGDWRAEYSPQFEEDLNDPRFSDSRPAVIAKCKLLLNNPYTAAKAERLKGDLRGKRSARVNRQVRIIYTICEECQRENLWPTYNRCCQDPSVRAPKTVNFLALSRYHYRDIPG